MERNVDENILGISEAFNHALEWRSRGADGMIRRDVSPALRATDYKCPKYVWYKSNEANMNEDKNQEQKIITRPHGYYKGEVKEHVAPAVKASAYAENNVLQEPINATPNFRIRKLTPRECFRLMDVDDKDIDKIQAYPFENLIEHPAYSKQERANGMTEKEKRRLMRKSISDSQQYKLAGNSIVVNVLTEIFRKLFVDTQNDDRQLRMF